MPKILWQGYGGLVARAEDARLLLVRVSGSADADQTFSVEASQGEVIEIIAATGVNQTEATAGTSQFEFIPQGVGGTISCNFGRRAPVIAAGPVDMVHPLSIRLYPGDSYQITVFDNAVGAQTMRGDFLLRRGVYEP